jgi:hypothetical protein
MLTRWFQCGRNILSYCLRVQPFAISRQFHKVWPNTWRSELCRLGLLLHFAVALEMLFLSETRPRFPQHGRVVQKLLKNAAGVSVNEMFGLC